MKYPKVQPPGHFLGPHLCLSANAYGYLVYTLLFEAQHFPVGLGCNLMLIISL